MLTSLIITDLTRMQGERVCIAGITEDKLVIRPEFDYGGITEDWLLDSNIGIVIRPFAKVQLDLVKSSPTPPHSEDWIIEKGYKKFERLLKPDEGRAFLQSILDESVVSIFGAEIHHGPGYFIKEGEGNRSLGTIKVKRIASVFHNDNFGKWNYRISFTDGAGDFYQLGVTDLTFRYYVDDLRERFEMDSHAIEQMLTGRLQKNAVYLRIGLARPTWPKHPHCCFLQVNGVYSFPDYLDDRCFADFKSSR